MRIFITSLFQLFLTISQSRSIRGKQFIVGIPNCGNETNMDHTLREDALRFHNAVRYYTAASHRRHEIRIHFDAYPTAANMSLMEYDCDLEKEAEEISSLCDSEIYPNFDYVGSNNASFDPPFGFEDLFYSMRGWWETNGHLGNLTPTADDKSMIPYLQLINDRTTKVGCSYSICNSTDSASFGMFVCKYGEPYVRADVPIYTEGPPCSLCKGRCVARALCNNTDII